MDIDPALGNHIPVLVLTTLAKGEQSFHDALMGAFEELKANGKAAEVSQAWFGRDVTAG